MIVYPSTCIFYPHFNVLYYDCSCVIARKQLQKPRELGLHHFLFLVIINFKEKVVWPKPVGYFSFYVFHSVTLPRFALHKIAAQRARKFVTPQCKLYEQCSYSEGSHPTRENWAKPTLLLIPLMNMLVRHKDGRKNTMFFGGKKTNHKLLTPLLI